MSTHTNNQVNEDNVYVILSANMNWVNKKLATMRRRFERNGFDFTYEVLGTEYHDVNIQDDPWLKPILRRPSSPVSTSTVTLSTTAGSSSPKSRPPTRATSLPAHRTLALSRSTTAPTNWSATTATTIANASTASLSANPFPAITAWLDAPAWRYTPGD